MTFNNCSFFKTAKIVTFTLLSALFIMSCGDDEPKVLATATFDYNFHNGEVVSAAPYAGVHPTDFMAKMDLQELENGGTRITISLDNTISGATYHMHAHDAADLSSTTNGTPYLETPNSDIFAQMLQGNGNSVSISQETEMSISELTNSYEGFFVIHDPLQSVSTTDISTYLIVGGFARAQGNASNFSSAEFMYDFNTGQLVPSFAYMGSHNNNLGASIRVDEISDNRSRIVASIINSMDGETYHTHAHDMADAATTPNMTPYNETPNAAVFASAIIGNGDTARKALVSDMSFTDITSNYDGFFVVHDPLQAITTVDPTTYVILGVFAR